ncbi:RluA family pseudouridine synthase [Aestuariispira insulae]|uniref:Pseudouridine synthase n=1 Tax=Aestuariispira insulae TaxID=1461337 RepID=A0A3D9HT31_9PROT|nr:RluA family pseudouridine synthase [Aestuariispira insulae]RED52511.1 RluA family pseudouridine synthase [Aestuariispira insulae]
MSGVQTRYVARNEADMRLDRWFKLHFPELPFGKLQKIVRKGEVRVNGKRAKTSQRLEVGMAIRIPPLGDAATTKAPSGEKPKYVLTDADRKLAQSLVIYKDKDVLAINKPSGLAVQGGTKMERHLDGMLEALTYDAEEKPRLVHRLDKDTSGVMLLARNRQSASDLGKVFKGRETRKIYWAILVGLPEMDSGTITLPLAKLPGKAGERMVVDTEEGKPSVTEFRVLERAGKRLCLVALWPKTGRTHQLRVHMAALGTPILGDGKYGGQDAFIDGDEIEKRLHLHAREIDIPGSNARVKAPLPDHMKTTFKLFGFDGSDWLNEDPFEDLID